MATGVLGAAARFVAFDVVGDVIRFPVWWYTTGLGMCVAWLGKQLVVYWRLCAIDIWLRNLFVPMFGQRDFQGRVISVAFRIVHIVGRTIGLLCVAIFLLGIGIGWLLAPVLVFGLVASQLFALFTVSYVG